MFDCILENSLKNIFQYLGQRKMKKKEEKIRNHCKCKPSTVNPPQTTMKKPTNQPSQSHRNPPQNPPQIINHMSNIGSWRRSTSELESTAKPSDTVRRERDRRSPPRSPDPLATVAKSSDLQPIATISRPRRS